MSKIYIVEWSEGSYDDYRSHVEPVCYSDISIAEKRKNELELSNEVIPEFPFEHLTEEDFENLDRLSPTEITQTEWEVYNQWWYKKYKSHEFNRAWITELEYYETH